MTGQTEVYIHVCRKKTRRQINHDRMISGDFSVNFGQIFLKFWKPFSIKILTAVKIRRIIFNIWKVSPFAM